MIDAGITLASIALAIASVAMIAKELCRPIVVASKGSWND